MKGIVAVDVDEVVANLLGEWLRRYNVDYNDKLTVDECKEWDMDRVVKPECGKKIYDYLHDKRLYDYVLPIPGARDGVYRLLAAGYRVVYVSACAAGTERAKMDWLVRWDFLTEATRRKDFIAAYDKSLVLADYLFDDKPANVLTFKGKACLIRRPHNAADRLTIPNQIDGMHVALDWIKMVNAAA